MKKKLLLILISSFALTGCQLGAERIEYDTDGYSMKELSIENVTVTFYKNIGKEEIDLNSGLYASGTTTAFKIDTIAKNSKVSKPETDPRRQNYVFDGWHLDELKDSPYDFNNLVSTSLSLYAHWSQGQEEEFVEPEYIEPSHIDDSIDTLVSITKVLNNKIENGVVKLSNSGISRLKRNDCSEVISALGYKMKSGVTLTATFNGTNTITFNATKEGEEEQNGTITIQNNSANLALKGTDDPTTEWWSDGETKATNYEAKDVNFEDHRIMLAGSSSMENWANSTEDLLPLKTYNHGIGGTIVEQWKDKLNQRLVYPYSPKILVYYLGVNNIIQKNPVSVADTKASLWAMFKDVHNHLPNTHIYYVMINELPNYRNKQAEFDAVNESVREYEATHDYLTTINAGTGLLKANGEPNQAYFLGDGLHMSLAGYSIWGKVIKNKLIEDLKDA